MSKDKSKFSECVGMLGIGICADYFIFRKDKRVPNVVFLSIGIALGVIHYFGLSNIIKSISGLF